VSDPVASPHESLIRRAFHALDQRDLEALTELADEAVEILTVTGALSGRTEPYRGHAGLAQYIDDLASTWRRLELHPQQFHALDEERVLVLGRVRAWHERGFLDSSNAWLWTIRDGRVIAARVYADPGEARRALFEDL
jgi:ketosteroid isomerase-like protein